MTLIDAYIGINKITADLIQNVVKLNKTKNEPVVDYIRLQESGFTVSEEDRQIQRALLTAYDLTQYKNEYHSLELAQDVKSWLSIMLGEVRKNEVKGI